MSQTVYFKSIIFLLLLVTPPLEAKLLKPSKNGEEKEILIINGKRRLYYPIKNEGMDYSIEGPIRLEFISRYPVLKNRRESHSYDYNIIINDEDTITVKHRFKVQKTIKSIQHPKHFYTYSGNYFINLDKGSHTIRLIENKDRKYPVLVRVLAKEFGSIGKNKKVLEPSVHQAPIKIITEGKSINYFECNYSYPLQLETNGNKTLRILTRLQFTESMGQEESYRLKVKEGDKIIGTYYFNTERSSVSEISGRLDKIPGKWRSCDIKIPKGNHKYIIETLDKRKTVLTRFIVY